MSDVYLLCDLDGVIDLDAKVANGLSIFEYPSKRFRTAIIGFEDARQALAFD
jgi:hypothetical protein